MEVISRADAKAAGLKRYFTGAPCKHGHVVERLVGNCSCVECENARNAAWRRRNPELKAEMSRGWYERNKERKRQTNSAWYELNKDIKLQTWRVWYERNMDRQMQKLRAWRELNKERIKQTNREWKLNNSDRVRLNDKNNRHKRRSQQRAGMSSAELSAWIERQPKACHWCGKKCAKKFHIDHYVPLSKGGAHAAENLVISCPSCNGRKHAKDPYEFANQVGRLF